MGKQEFIDGLRTALNGKISRAQLEDTVNYYQDYINMEVRKGKTEEEVLGLLGDPRLIARTIAQTSGQEGSVREAYREPDGADFDQGYQRQGAARMPGWVFGILAVIVICVLIGIVFSILSFLMPVIIVLAVVALLSKIFRDWLH